MMGLFIIAFFIFIGVVGAAGIPVLVPGTMGMLFVFGIVCLESFTLVKWFMGDQSLMDE